MCTRVGKSLKRIIIPALGTSRGAKSPTSPTTVPPRLSRSKDDRPGNRDWDVKFIYATFADGVDERRDVNGSIAGIAADVNRYLETQHPGHRARYDLFEGQLDIQHVEIPMTNKAFYELFVDDGWVLEDFFQSLLNGAGLN